MKAPFPRLFFALALPTTLCIAACDNSVESEPTSAAPDESDPAPAGGTAASSATAGCVAGDPGTGSPVSLPTNLTVGAFSVDIDAAGRLDVRHADGQDRPLFATAPGRPVLEVARVGLDVEENQGSFSVDVTVNATCTNPRLGRVVQTNGGVVLQGGFADCSEMGWELQLCEASYGHLAFAVAVQDESQSAREETVRVTLNVASEADERIFGMGEQFPHDTLNLKGRTIPVLSQEGGIGRGRREISAIVNAVSPGSGGTEETTYYAAPHYITSKLRSLFLENTEYAEFDFGDDNVTRIAVYSETASGRILFGTNPLELIERFTEYAGRMSGLPDWVHNGAVLALARDLPGSLQIVDALRERGARISGVWNQTWSGKAITNIGEQVLWNWVQNPSRHPQWSSFVQALANRGIRTLCYINPMLVDLERARQDGSIDLDPIPPGDELYTQATDYFVKRGNGEIYDIEVTAFEVGLFDLTNPEARRWIKDLIVEEFLGAGCSGWMVDFAEALPFDAVLASGESAASYHNQYPVDWMRVNREAIEEAGALGEVLLFNRSGHTRTPAHSMLLWEGDQMVTWDKFDGLTNAMRGLINGGFSGISVNHSDTGGDTAAVFDLLGLELSLFARERDMLKRWTEMNAFTAVLRTHESNKPEELWQVYGKYTDGRFQPDTDLIDHFARFTKVYEALGFYRRELVAHAAERGWPVVRHTWMNYPGTNGALEADDQFMLGDEIVVAPYTSKRRNFCWRCSPRWGFNKEVFLPPGDRWVHVWSGRVYGGGDTVRVHAPLGEPAVFYREGSAVGAQFVRNLREAGVL